MENGVSALYCSCHLKNVMCVVRMSSCVSSNSILQCENNSPGQCVFLLKPICEFTQLIHCDLRAGLLLFPSHFPL